MNVEKIKVGDLVFNRPVKKVTAKYIFIDPTCPWGKNRYTKKEVEEYYLHKTNLRLTANKGGLR